MVRRALGDVGSEWQCLEDGLLVASELVTNAVLHSGCATDHTIHVRASILSDGVLISVHDPGVTGQEAAPRPLTQLPAAALDRKPMCGSADAWNATNRPFAADARAGGWGLRVVEQLARRWGAERPDGYCVWAELALPS